MAEMKKRVRDSESEVESDCEDSPEAKRIRSDLLEILDDADEAELEPAVDEAAQQLPDLALVMKSFEEEISLPSPAAIPPPAAAESPELQEMGLGYLFEASDDELGLPPAISEGEENLKKEEEELPRGPSYGFGLDDDEQMWRFEDEMQNYDFGLLDSNNNGEFLALDGLFDHSDVYPVQSDFSDFFHRPESLSAL